MPHQKSVQVIGEELAAARAERCGAAQQIAHPIMSHSEEPSSTLEPEDDTRGMAYGGTTTRTSYVSSPR